MKKVWIITWWDNSERDISFLSAHAIEDTLKSWWYEVTMFDIPNELDALYQTLEDTTIDFYFVMIHWVWWEDGQIVSLLDMYWVTYQCTSRDVLSLTMNKRRTKCVWRSYGLPVANDLYFQIWDYSIDELDMQISDTIWYPCVWKELDQWSSKWIFIISDKSDLIKTRNSYDSMSKVILLEEFLQWKEFTTWILELQDWSLEVLPSILIEVEWWEELNFENKYNWKMNKICPAPFDDSTRKVVEEISLKAFLWVWCTKLWRIDWILTSKWPILLEINTIPWFTSTSLFPKAAKVAWYNFQQLLEILMKNIVMKDAWILERTSSFSRKKL